TEWHFTHALSLKTGPSPSATSSTSSKASLPVWKRACSSSVNPGRGSPKLGGEPPPVANRANAITSGPATPAIATLRLDMVLILHNNPRILAATRNVAVGPRARKQDAAAVARPTEAGSGSG